MKTHRFPLRPVLLAAMFVIIAAGEATAHPGHDHSQRPASSRTWTLATSGNHLQGTFVAAKNDQIQIRRDDGRLITVAVAELGEDDRSWLTAKQAQIRQLNERQTNSTRFVFAPDAEASAAPSDIASAFEPFARLNAITYRSDDRWFYVESRGIPDHPMMIGISSWQQQVPLPQDYTGDNAWQIPLHPVPAREPANARNRFLRGAIAVAVNGIPIFNPLNNRGDDAYLFGELDQYGGHCGRADDYHYHLAPVHLEKQVGQGRPIGYALDGYPIFGYDEPDGSKVSGLDGLNGHQDAAGHYHYHATRKYPYLNGVFYGEVVERDGQVEPQPHAQPVREALSPLRGAKVTDFNSPQPNTYRLKYELGGRPGYVTYSILESGAVEFEFTEPGGRTRRQTYEPSRRGPPPRRPDAARPPRGPDRPGSATATQRGNRPSELTVTCSAVDANGFLAAEFTCDGAGTSPPVTWSGEPEGTQCYAISLWHRAPDQEKSYWVVYDIPADVHELTQNSQDVGTVGLNDKRRNAYDPMCSKGPGVKTYHLTVYALSAHPKLARGKANRKSLLAAIKDMTLAEGTLDFNYERK